MVDVIVIFPQLKDGQGIRNLLMRNGYRVGTVCTSGAQARSYMDNVDYGVVVCGYKFSDMLYSELYEDLGQTFEMLLLASRSRIEEGVEDGVVCVEMPLKSQDLLNTLDMIMSSLERMRRKGKLKPKERNNAQKTIINEAKELLIQSRNWSEEEAHRYLQKMSMDSGSNMVETAQKILQLINR